jgi:hypothetical protein
MITEFEEVAQAIRAGRHADALQAAALAGIDSDELRGWAVRELVEPGVLGREVAARQAAAP